MDIQSQIQEARNAGYNDNEINGYLAKNALGSTQSTAPQDPISNIPIVGNIYDALGLNRLGGLGFEGARAIDRFLGNKNADTLQNPFFSSEQNQEFKQNPIMSVAKGGAIAATPFLPELTPLAGEGFIAKLINSSISGGVRGGVGGFGLAKPGQEVPNTEIGIGTGAILQPIMQALTSGLLTQKGVNNAVTEAKNASVARGDYQTESGFRQAINDELDRVDPYNLNGDLREAIQNRLNKLPPLTKGVTGGITGPMQIIEKATPFKGIPSNSRSFTNIEEAERAAQEGFNPTENVPEGATTTGIKRKFTPGEGSETTSEKQLSADWFHQYRQQLDDVINWSRKTNSPIEEQAAKFIRGVTSQQLHSLAPETKLLDMINHIYYNPAIKGGLKIPFTNYAPQWDTRIAGVPSALINTLAGIVGLEEGKKLIGR